MKLIFSQGNPGSNYHHTRHNIGWQVLDHYADTAEFHAKPKFFADIAELNKYGEKVLLIKPTTFYNETGRSVRALVDFYKLDPKTDLLVIHDDLALPLGTIRTRDKGSGGGNNGIKSINSHIGEDYPRLRVGINTDLRSRMSDADFVLANFTKNETENVNTHILDAARDIIDGFIGGVYLSSSYSLIPEEQDTAHSSEEK